MRCSIYGQLDRPTCVDRTRRFEAIRFRQPRDISSRRKIIFPIPLLVMKCRSIESHCSHHAITHRHPCSLLHATETSMDSIVRHSIICRPSPRLMTIFWTVIPFPAEVAFDLVSIVSATMHGRIRWTHPHRPRRALRTKDRSIMPPIRRRSPCRSRGPIHVFDIVVVFSNLSSIVVSIKWDDATSQFRSPVCKWEVISTMSTDLDE